MSPKEILGDVGSFIAKHPEVILEVKNAIDSGKVSGDQIVTLIKVAMTEASDKIFEKEISK